MLLANLAQLNKIQYLMGDHFELVNCIREKWR